MDSILAGVNGVESLQRDYTCKVGFPVDRPRSIICTGKVVSKVSWKNRQFQRFVDNGTTFRILSEPSLRGRKAAPSSILWLERSTTTSNKIEASYDATQPIRAGESFVCFIYGCSALIVLDPSPADLKSFTNRAKHSQKLVSPTIEPWWPASFTVRNVAPSVAPWLHDAMRALTKYESEIPRYLSRNIERQFELI